MYLITLTPFLNINHSSERPLDNLQLYILHLSAFLPSLRPLRYVSLGLSSHARIFSVLSALMGFLSKSCLALPKGS